MINTIHVHSMMIKIYKHNLSETITNENGIKSVKFDKYFCKLFLL